MKLFIELKGRTACNKNWILSALFKIAGNADKKA